jgi:malonyl-CoA O-methyltransferase
VPVEPRPQDLDRAALARHARRLAQQPAPWLHAEAARRMAERLSYIKLEPARLLEWSPHLGASTALLREAYPKAAQWWFEPHAALRDRSLAALQRPWWQRWQAPLAHYAETLPPVPPVDLLWANMSLHACPDLPETLGRWQSSLAVGGFVMFSCLGPDSFLELRTLFAREGWGAAGPQWWDMHDLGDLLVQAGFADPVMDQERLTLTWADVPAMLADLRALGGNVAVLRHPGLRSRAWREGLFSRLETLRNRDGRLALTLELVQGHAFKAAPRLKVAAETRVSIDQMREHLRGVKASEGKI